MSNISVAVSRSSAACVYILAPDMNKNNHFQLECETLNPCDGSSKVPEMASKLFMLMIVICVTMSIGGYPSLATAPDLLMWNNGLPPDFEGYNPSSMTTTSYVTDAAISDGTVPMKYQRLVVTGRRRPTIEQRILDLLANSDKNQNNAIRYG